MKANHIKTRALISQKQSIPAASAPFITYISSKIRSHTYTWARNSIKKKNEFLRIRRIKRLINTSLSFLCPQVNKLQGHSARVGALAWNGEVLSSGSRDRLILLRDVRTPCLVSERKLGAHRQEVCGLKWSPDNQYLASGGNDNRLYVWNLHSLSPVQTYTEHLAAVKAIAWSPHHHGLLASGGGTADRCIRFWNTLTGQPMQCVDTGSQVRDCSNASHVWRGCLRHAVIFGMKV